jgi:hypothetical protein
MNKENEKERILNKYFPNMGVGECDFDINTGKCKKCGIFFADSTRRLCAVISSDEIRVNYDDDNQWN